MTLYCFVDEQKAEGFPIERICEIACVSRSAYYDWKKHRCGVETAAELEERDLVADIAKIHKDSGGTYGSPRVTAELHDLGQVVNHKRVERLMRIHNIVGYTPPDKMVTTIPYPAHRIADLVNRDFFRDWLDQAEALGCSDIFLVGPDSSTKQIPSGRMDVPGAARIVSRPGKKSIARRGTQSLDDVPCRKLLCNDNLRFGPMSKPQE